MTQSPALSLEVNGTPPQMEGRVCEGFICEGYTYEGESAASANVTYLKFGGVWFRLYFESRLVFWRLFEGGQSYGKSKQNRGLTHTPMWERLLA